MSASFFPKVTGFPFAFGILTAYAALDIVALISARFQPVGAKAIDFSRAQINTLLAADSHSEASAPALAGLDLFGALPRSLSSPLR